MQPISSHFIKPPVPNPEQLAQLLEFQSATWPHQLGRFTAFKRGRDGDYVIYRSVAWNSYEKSLHVLRVTAGTPKDVGVWETWYESADDKPLDDIYLVDDTVMPSEMKGPRDKLRPSAVKGLDKRMRIVHAFAYLDPVGNGKASDFVFNDLVVVNESARSAALKRVVTALGQPRGFQTAVRKLFHKFVHNGGSDNALLRHTFRQGHPGMSRVGKNKRKPGPKSASEIRIASRNKAIGAESHERRHPVRPSDEVKFVRALEQHWARLRCTIRESYDSMVLMDYPKWPKRLIPSLRSFRFHAKRLIRDLDLKRLRDGKRLSAQYTDARAGQASHLTQGLIEILDVDGFVAKIGVAARIGARIESIHMTVMFAVSRLSGAILGYELAIRGENAEAFRRCIASVFLPKAERAQKLGLASTKGLLHGNVDAIFVDNGAGASEQVIVAACDEMGLMRMLPPPGRGDLKGVGEGVNSWMIRMMLREDSAYTRATDHLSQEMRRQKAKDAPIPLDRFERLLLRAIQHYNLFTNKKRLRSYEMRKAGIGVTPAAIFKYTQEKQRRGDARRKLTPREVFERFIPWQTRICQRGLVNFMAMRYSSDELVEHFNEHARQPGKRAPLPLRVKRLDGSPLILLWQRSDGTTSVLDMVEEDARSIGSVTWKGLEFLNADDSWQEEKLKPGRRASRKRVTAKVHASTVRADNIRAGNELGGLEGVNAKSARANAEAKQNVRRGAAQADAYGIANAGVEVTRAEPTRRTESAPAAESSYLRRLAQRLSSRKPSLDASTRR